METAGEFGKYVLKLAGNIATDVRYKVEGMYGSEIEKKVKEATSNESWGTSNTIKNEIAQATFSYDESYEEIMSIIWERMESSSWRVAFKTLTLLEHLIKVGSRRVIDESRMQQYRIRSLCNFYYIDDEEIDRGKGIRALAKKLCRLLDDTNLLHKTRYEASILDRKTHGHPVDYRQSRMNNFRNTKQITRQNPPSNSQTNRSRNLQNTRNATNVQNSRNFSQNPQTKNSYNGDRKNQDSRIGKFALHISVKDAKEKKEKQPKRQNLAKTQSDFSDFSDFDSAQPSITGLENERAQMAPVEDNLINFKSLSISSNQSNADLVDFTSNDFSKSLVENNNLVENKNFQNNQNDPFSDVIFEQKSTNSLKMSKNNQNLLNMSKNDKNSIKLPKSNSFLDNSTNYSVKSKESNSVAEEKLKKMIPGSSLVNLDFASGRKKSQNRVKNDKIKMSQML